MSEPILEADVLWWNDRNFRIRCPHCEDEHNHSISWDGPHIRVPHCGHPERYRCVFPFDNSNDQARVAYEIDKKNARFVNVCAGIGPSFDDAKRNDEVDLLAKFFRAGLNINEKKGDRGENEPDMDRDAKETVTVKGHGTEPFEWKTTTTAMSDCETGKVDEVKRYLETSAEVDIFVHERGRDEHTALISAAAEESADMVELLLKHGAKVNAVNREGRSALMEAALWGRLGNAKVLLKHGAEKNLRDDKGLLAVDLTQPTRRNKEERYRRAGGNVSFCSPSSRRPVYVEDTFKRDIDRQQIARLLGEEYGKSKIVYGTPPTELQLKDCRFKLSPDRNSISLHGPVASYPITKDNKTVARLERGGSYPSIAAMSGWSHGQQGIDRISAKHWTSMVRYISDVVGHTLESRDCDSVDWPGQFMACHAEKQLIAYFLERHVFLPRDVEPDTNLEAEIQTVGAQCGHALSSPEGVAFSALEDQIATIESELSDAEDPPPRETRDDAKIEILRTELKTKQEKLQNLSRTPSIIRLKRKESRLKGLIKRREMHQHLVNLSSAAPPVSLIEAVILISSPVCDDCEKFKNRVNSHFGLSIQLFKA